VIPKPKPEPNQTKDKTRGQESIFKNALREGILRIDRGKKRKKGKEVHKRTVHMMTGLSRRKVKKAKTKKN
jgi:hypothetical protein